MNRLTSVLVGESGGGSDRADQGRVAGRALSQINRFLNRNEVNARQMDERPHPKVSRDCGGPRPQ